MSDYRTQLEDAIVAAHEAGDYEAAQMLADELNAVPQKGFVDYAKDLGAGALRGAADIGNTLINASTFIPRKISPQLDQLNQDRESSLKSWTDANNPEGFDLFDAARIGTNVAGTAGAGGVLGTAMQVSPSLTRFAPVVQSGGFNLGKPAATTMLGKVGDFATRASGGAALGGTQAAMIDPSQVKSGAVIGAISPIAISAAGASGNAINSGLNSLSERLMRSALKPTVAAREAGDDLIAINTLLNNNLNVTGGGVNKLQDMIGNLSSEIDNMVKTANGNVSRDEVIKALNSSTQKFATQATPLKDLEAIKAVSDEFASVWPNQIPVQAAHELKKGTYRAINSKNYGELKGATIEAQKDLARGLKEGVEQVIPNIKGKNQMLGDYLKTMDVLSRATGRETNKDLLGLALLGPRLGQAASMAVDRNSLIKSLLARGSKKVANTVDAVGLPRISQQYGLPIAPALLSLETAK